jgi:hypothetical protein
VSRLAHLARGFSLSLGMRVERDLGKKQDAQHRQSEGKNPQQVTRHPAVTKHLNAYTTPIQGWTLQSLPSEQIRLDDLKQGRSEPYANCWSRKRLASRPTLRIEYLCQMKVRYSFQAGRALLMLAVLLLASASPSVCLICSNLPASPAQHTGVRAVHENDAAPDCDRDACSCCGFQLVAFLPGFEFHLIRLAPAREFLRLTLPVALVSPLYRPPRG